MNYVDKLNRDLLKNNLKTKENVSFIKMIGNILWKKKLHH